MKNRNRLIYDCLVVFAIITTAGCSTKTSNSRAPLVIAEQGFFFVGGRYVPVAKDDYIMADQMYVHYQIPHEKKYPYPIIMIHGGGQTANNFESTPDGREGWATNFLHAGFTVYLVDQPGRARSPYQSEVYGPLANGSRARLGSSSVSPRHSSKIFIPKRDCTLNGPAAAPKAIRSSINFLPHKLRESATAQSVKN